MPRPSNRWALTITLILSFGFIVDDFAEAKKDDLMDIIAPAMIGSSIGESLGRALEAAHGMAAATAEASASIKSAREQFWQQYPSGSNRRKTEAEFSRQLELKDLHYLLLAAMNWENKRTEKIGIGTLLERMSGQIDGGIPRKVLPEFEEWTDAVMEQLERDERAGKDRLSLYFNLLPNAIKAAPEKYQRYKFARDWYEFDAANREPEWVKTSYGYAIYLVYRFGQTKPEEAIDVYNDAVDVFGEDHVHKTAERIRPAHKKRADKVDLKSLGLVQYRRCTNKEGVPYACEEPVPSDLTWVGMSRLDNVFMTLLATGDIRHYIMGLYFKRAQRNYRTDQREFWNWKQADYFYRDLINAYGEKAVHDAATKVQRLPKRIEDGEIKDPIYLEVGTDLTHYVLLDLLAKDDPIGYVKLIALHTYKDELAQNCHSKITYDAAYRDKDDAQRKRAVNLCVESPFKSEAAKVMESQYSKLERNYGKERIRAVGQAIYFFWNPGPVALSETCSARQYQARHPANFPTGQYFIESSLLEQLLDTSRQQSDKESSPPIENPAYTAWARFRPGAFVVMEAKGSLPRNGEYTVTLSSVTKDRFSTILSAAFMAGKDMLAYSRIMQNREEILESLERTRFHGTYMLPLIRAANLQPIQQQTLVIDGAPIETKVYLWERQIQIWTSERVPGGLVRVVWNLGESEVILKSFSGTQSEGILPMPDLSSRGDLSRLTCNFNRPVVVR